jgi:hypothetical protein
MLFDFDPCGDNYATADIGLYWTSNGTSSASISTSSPRLPGGSFLRTAAGNSQRKAFVVGSVGTVTVGLAVRRVSSSGTAMILFELTDASTTQLRVTLNSDLTISIVRGDGTILATSSQTISINTWYWMELMATIHPSTGAFTFRLNETQILNATGQNTRNTSNSSCNGLRVQESLDVDDLHLIDTTGSALTGFPGDSTIEYLPANGAGTTTEWTPVGSTPNYQAVDEAVENGDTDYVSSATVGQKDTYALGNLSSTPSAIRGVKPVVIARKDDVGTATVAPVVRSGGTDYDQTSTGLSTSYAPLAASVLDVDPATGVAWTATGVNALQVGQKLVA